MVFKASNDYGKPIAGATEKYLNYSVTVKTGKGDYYRFNGACPAFHPVSICLTRSIS